MTDLERVRAHVLRLGEKHPPVPLDSVDYTLRSPSVVKERFASTLTYMARVEMEVERNVLELAMLLPGVDEVDELFYRDVWSPQEAHHGVILDTVSEHLGLTVVADTTTVSASVRVLGALAHVQPVQEVIRMMYYLTGAATEKSAMTAYAAMHKGLLGMQEGALAEAVAKIKVQEPGHFAFYKLRAEEMLASRALAPWQLHLLRFLRSRAFTLVGARTRPEKAHFGRLIKELDLEPGLDSHLRDIARVETQVLWAHKEGLVVPPYVLRAFREASELASR
jgi:hypothetical protein